MRADPGATAKLMARVAEAPRRHVSQRLMRAKTAVPQTPIPKLVEFAGLLEELARCRCSRRSCARRCCFGGLVCSTSGVRSVDGAARNRIKVAFLCAGARGCWISRYYALQHQVSRSGMWPKVPSRVRVLMRQSQTARGCTCLAATATVRGVVCGAQA